jgi:hypothetical protein
MEGDMHMSEKLVDFLAEQCNLLISDLRRSENYIRILSAVRELEPSRFTAEDWSNSLTYIFGITLSFEDSQSAKDYCVEALLRGI